MTEKCFSRKKLLLISLAAMLLVGYLFLFFQRGISLSKPFSEGRIFLRATVSEAGTVYRGTFEGTRLSITLSGNARAEGATVTYQFGEESRSFTVLQGEDVVAAMHGSRVRLLENGTEQLCAIYQPGFPFLREEDGELIVGELSRIITGSEASRPVVVLADFLSDFLTIKLGVGDLGSTTRGEPMALLVFLLLGGLLAIDIAFPLLGFELQHRWTSDDATPNDFYFTMQHAERFILSVMLLGFMLYAIW